MNRHTWTILFGVLVAGFLSPQAQAQTYAPYTPPTIGDIQTLCVEQYPAPQTRTDVGIGEQVSCWIDTSTWQDTDIEYLGENQYYVSDTLGSITWTVSGPGSVYPTTGSSTTLMIDLVDADDAVTVTATVTDSGTMGVDPPVNKQKGMNVKVPTGVNPIAFADQPPFQAGVDLIGCRTKFMVQVIPQTVNFNNVNVRENKPKYTWTWPNGTNDTINALIVGPLKPGNIQIGQVIFPNIIGDDVGTFGAGYTVDFIKDKNTGQFVDFDQPNPAVPMEYQDKDGKWQNFDNKGTHPRHWTGATKAGRCGIVAAGTLWGSNQGPFKKPN
jgi:hypothetical protein